MNNDFNRRTYRAANVSPLKPNHYQVEHVLSRLNELVRSGNMKNAFIVESKTLLESLKEITKTMDSSEKSYCILFLGALSIIMQCICFCGKIGMSNDILIDIISQMIDNSQQDSRLFCKMILDHLNNDIECVGASDCLTKIILVHSIRSLFVEDICIPRILDIYFRCSTSLAKLKYKPYEPAYITPTTNYNNNQSNGYHVDPLFSGWENGAPPPPPSGFTFDNLFSALPTKQSRINLINNSNNNSNSLNGLNNNNSNRSLRESTTTTMTDSSVGSPMDISPMINSTPKTVQPLSMSLSGSANSSTTTPIVFRPSGISLPTSPGALGGSGPIVPALKLSGAAKPVIPKLVLPNRVENSAKMTRSSRRRDDVSSNRSVTSASKELSDLATKLGETYMTTDLTALISYKQSITSHGAKRPLSMSLNSNLTISTSSLSSDKNEQLSMNNLYRVRCDILKTILSTSDFNLWLLQYNYNPINMLYSELVLIHKGVIPTDEYHLNLFFQMASSWADFAEYIHRNKFKDLTKFMTSERKVTFRKKLDLFLYRVNISITGQLDIGQYGDIEYQLAVLSMYLEKCPTRIISNQVVDVCIETLLKLKHQVFKGKITNERIKDIHIIHYLLCVFDRIITLNLHQPLNELLMAIFLERDDTFNFIKHYTSQILSSESIEKEFVRLYSHINPKKLSEFRCRSIQHHSILIDMIKGTFDTTSSDVFIQNKSESHDLERGIDLLKKMEYLILPVGGVILPFLQSSPSIAHFEVKKSLLDFLANYFTFKKNPFTKKKLYIDSYISYIYISFIKLYNNNLFDPQTLTLCKLYLDVLLAFSVNKNDKISMKFYQLRTMDFLVREINLEYEIKQNRDSFINPSIPFFKSTPNNSSPLIQPKKTESDQPTSHNNTVVSGSNTTSSPSQPPPSGAKKPIPLLKLPLKLATSSSSSPVMTTPVSSTSSPLPNNNNNNNNVVLTSPPVMVTHIPKISITDSNTSSDNHTPLITTPPTTTVPKVPLLNTSLVNTNKPVVPAIAMGKISIPKLVLPAVKPPSASSTLQPPEETKSKPSGILSALEKKMDPHDPKFQLVLDNPIQSLKSIQEQSNNNNTSSEQQNQNPEITNSQRYVIEKNNRKIYHDKDLQISLIKLIFSLLLNSNQTLEHLYSDQYPLVAKKLNVPFILHNHINHPENEMIIPELCKGTHEMGPNYFRMMKLLFNRLFHTGMFKDLKRVAKGAYGTVYKGTLAPDEGLEIAVKLMAVPKSIHDRCVLYDIFTEILIMDTFKNDPRGCHLFDYGMDGENYWIVMKSYKCSLKEWRSKQTLPFLQQLPLYLNIFHNVLLTVQFLAENKVNHFDIKCDNFLIHPIKKGTLDEDFWNQKTNEPNFTVSLADWGEAKVYTTDLEGYTTRNRGTEFIKSPEMLTVAYASQKTRENFDRRKKVGSNTASDVWSIGCLFFELITGDFLFYEDDWVKFFIRLTQPGQELITPDRKAKIFNIPGILEFLDYVFVRDPFYRPSLRDILTKFTAIKPVILQQLEKLRQANEGQFNPDGPKEFNNGGDGARYKGPLFGNKGHYTPGRFFPHSMSDQPKDTVSTTNEVHEFPEHRHYMDFPSKINSFLYLSSFHPSADKQYLINTLHITHIVNCTGSPNAFPDHFEYLHLQLHDSPSQDILHSLTNTFDFIRNAIMHHGKVLIYSDKGVSRSAALAIAYFMDTRSISYFEAFTLIRDRRYIVAPNAGFVEQLCRWGRQRRIQKGLAEWGGGEIHSNTSTTQFQCLCGACVFTLLTNFDSSPKPCTCSNGKDCPNFLGCLNFLMEMKKKNVYNYLEYVLWGYTNVTNIVGDYSRSSIEVQNFNISNGKKEWVLYKCQTCKFLTHALSTSVHPDTHEKIIAIVTNIRTNQIPIK